MGFVRALWHTFVNMFFGVLKKIFYVKHVKENLSEETVCIDKVGDYTE